MAYVPGVCNINHAEIEKRRRIGYIGAVVLVLVLGGLFALGVNRWVRLVVFVPAMMSTSGFLQAKNKFCSGYGGRGLQNADEGSPAASAVTDAAAQQKDRARSRQINLQAAGVALVVTILAVIV